MLQEEVRFWKVEALRVASVSFLESPLYGGSIHGKCTRALRLRLSLSLSRSLALSLYLPRNMTQSRITLNALFTAAPPPPLVPPPPPLLLLRLLQRRLPEAGATVLWVSEWKEVLLVVVVFRGWGLVGASLGGLGG